MIALRADADGTDTGVKPQFSLRVPAFCEQHVDDLLGAVITEQLAELLFVKGNLMFGDKLDKIILRIAGKC